MHTIHEQNEACSLGVRIVCGHIRGRNDTTRIGCVFRKSPGQVLVSTSTLLAGLRHCRRLNSDTLDGSGKTQMYVRKIVSAVALAALLGACAGRDAAYIPITQPSDQALDRNALNTEMNANNAKISSLSAEESNKRGQNIAMGVAGAVLFWPALFFMDFKDAAGTDRKAVESRQSYLTMLYAQKQCSGSMSAQAATGAGWR
jgi:hypothetical protein